MVLPIIWAAVAGGGAIASWFAYKKFKKEGYGGYSSFDWGAGKSWSKRAKEYDSIDFELDSILKGEEREVLELGKVEEEAREAEMLSREIMREEEVEKGKELELSKLQTKSKEEGLKLFLDMLTEDAGRLIKEFKAEELYFNSIQNDFEDVFKVISKLRTFEHDAAKKVKESIKKLKDYTDLTQKSKTFLSSREEHKIDKIWKKTKDLEALKNDLKWFKDKETEVENKHKQFMNEIKVSENLEPVIRNFMNDFFEIKLATIKHTVEMYNDLIKIIGSLIKYEDGLFEIADHMNFFIFVLKEVEKRRTSVTVHVERQVYLNSEKYSNMKAIFGRSEGKFLEALKRLKNAKEFFENDYRTTEEEKKGFLKILDELF